MDHGHNIQMQKYKTSSGNTGENIFDLRFGDEFSDTPKAWSMKEKFDVILYKN